MWVKKRQNKKQQQMEYVVKQRDDTDDNFVEAIAQKIVYSYQACQIPEDMKQIMKAR